jgi:dihydropyrimidinase
MDYDLVIKNGQLITADDTYRADVGVKGERIAAIGAGLSGQREIDAQGLYVLPGAIDGHMHLTDPTYSPKYMPTADSFATASVAAAHGGTTMLIDFAQPRIGEGLVDVLDRRQEDADGHTVLDYSLHLNLRDPDPKRLEEFPAVFERGVPSFKFFMAYDSYRLDDVALFRAMEAVAAGGGLAIVHAENYDIITEMRRRLDAEGKTGPRWHVAASPAITEGEAVHQALAFGKLAGARTLIYHQSCIEGVREIRHAKQRGQEVYGEVCVQYLVHTSAVYESGRPEVNTFMVSPPIREAEHQAALWQGLADGALDIVSTDHNPRAPRGEPRQFVPGSSSIEPRLALVHHFGVNAGRLSLNRWVEVCCTRPAEVFGLARKGRLQPGCDADIVLFDPQRPITLGRETLHSPIEFSTYEGIAITGFPVTTISRGEVLVEAGQFVGQPGRGRFVERGY